MDARFPMFSTAQTAPMTERWSGYSVGPFSTANFLGAFKAAPDTGHPITAFLSDPLPGESNAALQAFPLETDQNQLQTMGYVVHRALLETDAYVAAQNKPLPLDIDATVTAPSDKASWQIDAYSPRGGASFSNRQNAQMLRLWMGASGLRITTGSEFGDYTVLQNNSVRFISPDRDLELTTDGYFMGVRGFETAKSLLGLGGKTPAEMALSLANLIYANLSADRRAELGGFKIMGEGRNGIQADLIKSNGRLVLPHGVDLAALTSVFIASNAKTDGEPYAEPLIKIVFHTNPTNGNQSVDFWMNAKTDAPAAERSWALPEGITSKIWLPIEARAMETAQAAWTTPPAPDFVLPSSLEALKPGDRIQMTLSDHQTPAHTMYARVATNADGQLTIKFENKVWSYDQIQIPIQDGKADLKINPGTEFEETWTLTIVKK